MNPSPASCAARFLRLPAALSRPLARIRASAALALAATLCSMAARAQADCPPTPQMPTAEQVQTLLREARDHGMLWRLERDGRVGWLYGTLHVGRQAWSAPGPRLLAALTVPLHDAALKNLARRLLRQPAPVDLVDQRGQRREHAPQLAHGSAQGVQRQVQPLLTGVQRIQPVADGPRHGVEGAAEPADFVVAFSHQS